MGPPSSRSTVTDPTRISTLTDRLLQLQTRIEQNRTAKIDTIQSEIDDCSERLEEAEAYREEEMLKVKDYVVRLFGLIEAERQTLSSVGEAKATELRDVEDSLADALEEYRATQRESTVRMTTLTDKHFSEIDEALITLAKDQEELYKRNKRAIDIDLLQLQGEIEQEEMQASSLLAELETRLRARTSELRQRLKSMEHERRRTEAHLRSLIGEVYSRLEGQLEKETREREAVEQTILSVVEQTAMNYMNLNDNI